MTPVLLQADDAIDLVRGEQVAMLGVTETTFRTMELPEGLADHDGGSSQLNHQVGIGARVAQGWPASLKLGMHGFGVGAVDAPHRASSLLPSTQTRWPSLPNTAVPVSWHIGSTPPARRWRSSANRWRRSDRWTTLPNRQEACSEARWTGRSRWEASWNARTASPPKGIRGDSENVLPSTVMVRTPSIASLRGVLPIPMSRR